MNKGRWEGGKGRSMKELVEHQEVNVEVCKDQEGKGYMHHCFAVLTSFIHRPNCQRKCRRGLTRDNKRAEFKFVMQWDKLGISFYSLLEKTVHRTWSGWWNGTAFVDLFMESHNGDNILASVREIEELMLCCYTPAQLDSCVSNFFAEDDKY